MDGEISLSKEGNHSWAFQLAKDFRDFGVYPKNIGKPLKQWDDVKTFVF